MTFKELELSNIILKSLKELKHDNPTPIQELAIPHILKGEDVLGCAQTGTGKTAAFVLPIIEHLINSERSVHPQIKALILSPTRELAIQTRDNFRKYGKYTDIECGVVLGGVNQRSQEKIIKRGLDVLVATPGRLLDLVNQHIIKLNLVDILVLDEADTMLDMGFIHDIRKVVSNVKKERQTLMFSATMPNTIRELAKEFLNNPVVVETETESVTVDKIKQSVYFVDSRNKASLLLDLLKTNKNNSTLIFTRTKHKANKLLEVLEKNNIHSEIIHGNKSQNARVNALKNFKSGKSNILIATDIAARGIDITELSQVINFELPEFPESYIHRIGRTGRAGCIGNAISFCDRTEKRYLNDIEKLIKQKLIVIDDHNYPLGNFDEDIKKDFKRSYNKDNKRKTNNTKNKR